MKVLVPLNCIVKYGYNRMFYVTFITLKTIKKAFPDGSVVKNLPANAGDMGSSPDPGRSHVSWGNEARGPQVLSLSSRAQEPQRLSPCALEPGSATEAAAVRSLPH